MKPYENAIEIEHLTKRYDGFTLDDVSFCVPKGSIMGFIGQNGAGKSTTINTILNIIKADSGTIRIFGMDHLEHEYEIKEHIAAIFDALPFHDQLNAKQLNIMMKGIYRNWNSETFFGYLKRLQLPEKKKFGQFSKGMKMKLQIAAALSHGAKLLIMDEATTGLDPVVRNEILDIFQEYLQDDSNSILMSSHITSDLDRIADSVTFIHKGKLLLTGYKDEILENHAIIKCTKKDYADMDPADIVSARISDFGAEVLVADRAACKRKYSQLVMDNTTLEELMRFYVNAEKKEWTT
ncbi:MAG: ABC transporter ATP-binding protein [Ruminococcus sp.]|nr:ABC transporter ATP-binding protein [Ruminococcus sp.]